MKLLSHNALAARLRAWKRVQAWLKEYERQGLEKPSREARRLAWYAALDTETTDLPPEPET